MGNGESKGEKRVTRGNKGFKGEQGVTRGTGVIKQNRRNMG